MPVVDEGRECPRVDRVLRGCRWRARYDTHIPPTIGLPVLMSGDVKSLVARSIYVRDVCETCGAIKERKQ